MESIVSEFNHQISVNVTNDVIDLQSVIMKNPACTHGAGNIFIGYVRDLNLGKKVVGIEYDCYESMCLKVFKEITLEALVKWDKNALVTIIHRQGFLNVSEVSVVIMVTSKHRDESYKISRYIIEEIKTRAPIWKKEFYTDGETDWVKGHALCQHRKVDHHESDGHFACGGTIHSHAKG